jgi:penicillin G amidase
MTFTPKRSIVLIFLLIVVFGSYFFVFRFNASQTDGVISVPGLNKPVRVVRDAKNMAYVYAENSHDVFFAQGFITAQDRLFSMEIIKRLSRGRVSEIFGDKALATDKKMRAIGFYRNAQKHAAILSDAEHAFFQSYVDGVNSYIETRQDHFPIKLKLAGIVPEPWTVPDSLSILYYMGWGSSANLQDEIITQMLIEKLGLAKASELFPLNINPDDSADSNMSQGGVTGDTLNLNMFADAKLNAFLERSTLEIGSNNWAANAALSTGDKPIVSNDPHLEATKLPGPWYPMGLFCPDFRSVGVNVPGIPGMVIGRTDHVALGVTNAYGDSQDLYVETVDPKNPDRYLEGETSIAFKVIDETIRVKDKDAPEGFREERFKIKLTRRGPVISDILKDLTTDKLMTLRFSMFEGMAEELGLRSALYARSTDELQQAIGQITAICLNFTYADTQGNIGWQVSGKLPVRSENTGMIPFVVKDSTDNWKGWIKTDEMPQRFNPQRGWLGTCNHKTVDSEYPYYYTSHYSPSFRYRRLKQLFDSKEKFSVDDHWNFMRDTKNLMAEKIAPKMAAALEQHPDTQQMGEILAAWDYRDDIDKAAPAIFQSVYRNFAILVYQDELGEGLASVMLANWYYWQESLLKQVLAGEFEWFDDVSTPKKETMDDLFYQAALNTVEEFAEKMGSNPAEWRWGKIHQLEFVSMIRQKGMGKSLLGGGAYEFGGSGETLYRGYYKFNKPYDAFVTASLRMVADLSDADKVAAVLPGGTSGRLMSKHRTDQIDAFINGEKRYWWFSDKEIQNHSKHELVLNP